MKDTSVDKQALELNKFNDEGSDGMKKDVKAVDGQAAKENKGGYRKMAKEVAKKKAKGMKTRFANKPDFKV